MKRDVDRRVDLKFGEVVGELLESVDDLELAMAHVADVPEALSLLEGLTLARNRFLGTLERHGVEALDPMDGEFDPNQEEAVRVDPVDSKERDGTVTETLRPGYRLGELIIRPARVAVGRYTP
jgi:molecular chaperone GrpE